MPVSGYKESLRRFRRSCPGMPKVVCIWNKGVHGGSAAAQNITNSVFWIKYWGLRSGGSYQYVVEETGLEHQQKWEVTNLFRMAAAWFVPEQESCHWSLLEKRARTPFVYCFAYPTKRNTPSAQKEFLCVYLASSAIYSCLHACQCWLIDFQAVWHAEEEPLHVHNARAAGPCCPPG